MLSYLPATVFAQAQTRSEKAAKVLPAARSPQSGYTRSGVHGSDPIILNRANAPGGYLLTSLVDAKVLTTAPVFRGLTDTERDQILSGATVHRYKAGVTVFEQGEPATRFYVLVSGRLRVTQLSEEGEQTIVRIVNPGDLFGIARALSRPDYPGTATAAVESTALHWPMGAWDELLARFPMLAVNAMQIMGHRLQQAHSRLRELSNEEVERRVAHAVLRLAGEAGRKEPEGIRIDFPVSKKDIAELSGTTLHTVSRILSLWERAGLVSGGRQKLLVRDAHRLFLIGEGHHPGLL